MKKNAMLKTLAALTGLLACQGAFAADDVTVTAGLKMWNNKWSSWDVIPPARSCSTTGACGYSENYTSGDNAAWIPSASVRYRDFLVAGSYFANHSYGFAGANGNSFNGDRKEMDIVAGYYVLPTVAVIGGYKEVKQSFSGTGFKYSGPIFGVNASAPLTGGFSLYGTAALGRLDANLPDGLVTIGATSSNNYNADYKLGEVGLAYAFDVRASMPGMKSLVATLGYRNQVIATNAQIRDTPTTSRGTELRDTTEGLTLGLTAVF